VELGKPRVRRAVWISLEILDDVMRFCAICGVHLNMFLDGTERIAEKSLGSLEAFTSSSPREMEQPELGVWLILQFLGKDGGRAFLPSLWLLTSQSLFAHITAWSYSQFLSSQSQLSQATRFITKLESQSQSTLSSHKKQQKSSKDRIFTTNI